MTALSIVLPCYNERGNIVPLVSELIDRVGHLGDGLEILVVDDDSPDGTAQAVRDAFAAEPRVHLVVRTANRGFALSIREGLERATGDVLVVMDTDFNHPPEIVPALFHVAAVADLVIGSRFTFGGGMPDRVHYFLSYGYNMLMRLVLGTRISDNLSGMFAIRRDKLALLDFDSIFWGYGDYFFRLLLLAQRGRFQIIEVPVQYGERRHGETKTRFLSIFSRYTREVFNLAIMRILGRW